MTTTVEVAIIGAGISGIGAAIKLLEIGVDDFVVLEKGDSVGGTWRDNTYPGCACDVPSILYSYSFAPNPHWTRSYATQPEILAYLQSTAATYGVLPRVRLETEVEEARWHPDTSTWRLRTTQGEIHARFLIAAAGPWHEPNVPDIDGLDSFPGPVFHSSRWDHEVDLTDKRVAVVGTGASVVQLLPAIAPIVAELHLFQRTPQWVLPKPDKPTSRLSRLALAGVPGAHQARWRAAYNNLELIGYLFRHSMLQPYLKSWALKNLHASIDDPALREALTPDWDVGCKRLLSSNDYYPALARPTTTVHPTALAAVRGDVVVGADGSEAAVDVIVLGTGFRILDMPIAGRVHDAAGRSLADHWQGSPQAYLGTTVAGFPNLYLLFGPSLGTVSSAFVIIESQLRHIMAAVAFQRENGVDLEVRDSVQQRFNQTLQSALAGTVYNAGGCRSYYFDANGRNSFSWPWSTGRLRRELAAFDPDDYLTHPSPGVT